MLGLIRPFMPRGRHRLTSYVHVSAQTHIPEFIDLDSCERAVLLLGPSPQRSEQVVHDLVDGDMYFRLSSIK